MLYVGLSGTRWDIKSLLLFNFMLWSYRQQKAVYRRCSLGSALCVVPLLTCFYAQRLPESTRKQRKQRKPPLDIRRFALKKTPNLSRRRCLRLPRLSTARAKRGLLSSMENRT